jgi:lysophospholipase L1-like esterase
MVKGVVGKLTMNDFVIICSGTNDIDRNYSRNAFKNITTFIKNVNHTNMILISVPYRYDLTDYSHVNSTMKSLNSKLLKLAKIFSHVSIIEIFNNRLLFTKHGLHLNESGKELLSNQLVLHIFSILEEVIFNPITLEWYDKNPQVNASSITRSSHTLNPISCQLPTK